MCYLFLFINNFNSSSSFIQINFIPYLIVLPPTNSIVVYVQ